MSGEGPNTNKDRGNEAVLILIGICLVGFVAMVAIGVYERFDDILPHLKKVESEITTKRERSAKTPS